MDIILATRNSSKAEQIKAIFAGLPISILTLTEAGIEGQAIEDGKTLGENALKKALFVWKETCYTMADDTGLFINALGGKPGVMASRWAGETATTEQIMLHTLKMLKGKINRQATFKTVVALVTPKGKQYFFEGNVEGHILQKPRCLPQLNMPYSPIFMAKGADKVWAEMTVEEENAISHRGIAFRKVRSFLEKLL